ncbi:hypothetical protein [Ideonella sp. BN130291]|uniref:hypothetical protein n=1 Tax=Ideonella sp. BN130291 TaxID=3112940 RepID=UPI002E263ED1|nr:hypothetical protein [Ideonella sp. BN130291]
MPRHSASRPLLAVALACATLLSACGGGGGDSSSTSSGASAGSDVSVSNYQSLATPLARTVVNVAGSADVSGASGGTAQGASTSAVRTALRSVVSARAVALRAGGQARVTAVTSDTVACDSSGSVTITFNDADNNGQLSVGDSISLMLSNCAFTADEPAANGGLSMTLQGLQIDGQGIPSALQASGSFNALSVGADSMSGQFQMSYAPASGGMTSVSMSFTDMTASTSGQTVVYNTTFSGQFASDGSGSFSITGRLGLGGETYLLDQPQPFVLAADGHPTSGSLRMRDAAGDALVVRARPGDLVDFEFYPAGATTPSATLTGQPWSNYGG